LSRAVLEQEEGVNADSGSLLFGRPWELRRAGGQAGEGGFDTEIILSLRQGPIILEAGG